jgi:Uma2 family endonuclease
VNVIDPSTLAPERIRPLRRAEYDRLVQLGCFEDERIELLDGLLVATSPQGAPHMYVIQKLCKMLTLAIGERAIVRGQGPLAISDDSEPEPDVALVPNEDYSHEHATWAFLVVEVAETSLRKDRLVKAAMYARAGIPEYWIVNLEERAVEVYRAPRGGAYASVTAHEPHETLAPEAFSDVKVPVAEVLPTRWPPPFGRESARQKNRRPEGRRSGSHAIGAGGS